MTHFFSKKFKKNFNENNATILEITTGNICIFLHTFILTHTLLHKNGIVLYSSFLP